MVMGVVLLSPPVLCLRIVPTHHELSDGYDGKWTSSSNRLLV